MDYANLSRVMNTWRSCDLDKPCPDCGADFYAEGGIKWIPAVCHGCAEREAAWNARVEFYTKYFGPHMADEVLRLVAQLEYKDRMIDFLRGARLG